MDFSNYKFRCSSLGYIMTEPKGKSYKQQYDEAIITRREKIAARELLTERAVKTKIKLTTAIDELTKKINDLEPKQDSVQLSDSAKTHLCDLYTVAKYGRHEDIKSKYLEKGLHMEEDAITLYSVVKRVHHEKNTEEKENDYIKGHIDFPTLLDCIVDTKSNWNIFTFNRVVARPIKPLYAWQGKGYMWLWEKERFELAYCLLDTPEHLYKAEQRKLMYELVGRQEFTSDEEKEMYSGALFDLHKLHHYKDIPDEEKIRIFELKRNKEDEEKIKRYVVAAREFMNSIDKKEYDDSGTTEETV